MHSSRRGAIIFQALLIDHEDILALIKDVRSRGALENWVRAAEIVPSNALELASAVVAPVPSSKSHAATVFASGSRCMGGTKLAPE